MAKRFLYLVFFLLIFSGCISSRRSAIEPLPGELVIALIEEGDAPVVGVFSLNDSGRLCFEYVGGKRKRCRLADAEVVRSVVSTIATELEGHHSNVEGVHSRRLQIQSGDMARIYSVKECPEQLLGSLQRVEAMFSRHFGSRAESLGQFLESAGPSAETAFEC